MSTETERQGFEAWWKEYDKQGVVSDAAKEFAFDAWLAARRDPVVPQGLAGAWEFCAADVESDHSGAGLHFNQGVAEGMRICAKDLRNALAAAPQPPEVAHVSDCALNLCDENGPHDAGCHIVRQRIDNAAAHQPQVQLPKPRGGGSPRRPCPQHPPEVAPAQLPAPVAVAFKFETDEGGETAAECTARADQLEMGWTPLYAEQQVLEMLAKK